MPVEMVKITMGADAESAFKHYIRNKIDWLKQCHQNFHQTHLPRWRKMYDAVPREVHKSFPWPNASNLVVPIVAIHTDTLHARVMAAVFRTIPLWICRTVGEHDGIEPLREAQEQFLNYVGMERGQLDLYRVYNQFYKEAIKIGTSVIKCPWTKVVETQILGSVLGDIEAQDIVRKEGPIPGKIPIEDFFIPPQAVHEDDADFIAHRIRMTREDLEQRKFLGLYENVDKVLAVPTRASPSTTQQQKEDRAPVKTAQGFGWAEWDIWECHLQYHVRTAGFGFQGGSISEGFVRVIATYHYETGTLLRAVYNFYPDNSHPFVASRLTLRDDAFYGKGFAESLENMQEEASTIHNQRIDNASMANMRFFTIRNNPKMNDSWRLYPGAMLPVTQQEDIKERQLGDVYPSTFEGEKATMDIAERTSGVSPPMQGYGAGVMQGKRGVYTALGTMSMMQEGNRRTDLAISDLRYPHVSLGRKVRAMYAAFGIPQQLIEVFGNSGQYLKQAFTLEALKKLEIPITSATASINREVERQNLLMLTNQLGTFYQQMSQLMVAINNPMVPPQVKDYLTQVATCATNLETRLMKAFDYDDISRYVPRANTLAPNAPPPGTPQVLQQPSGPGMGPGGVQPPPPLGLDQGQPFMQGYSGGVPGSGDMLGIGPGNGAGGSNTGTPPQLG